MRTIEIRREDKSPWEARAPLSPKDASTLSHRSGISFKIQHSAIRAYSDAEYEVEKIPIDENIWCADLVIAVKEIPENLLVQDGNYLYFSHTTKGQPYNMPMLDRLMKLGCTLLDYELITDDAGRRLIFFGSFAGYAGMIDSLHAFGRKLLAEGMSSPFADVKMTYEYKGLKNAESAMRILGREITENGIPKNITPLVIGFTGYGNVSKGAQHIAGLLPHKYIDPSELSEYFNKNEARQDCVYLVVFEERHMFEPNQTNERFDLNAYFKEPRKYHSVFGKYLVDLSIAVNCIFWTADYPRLITKKILLGLFAREEKTPKLKVLGDITCDIDGSFETTYKATSPTTPCYIWNPADESFKDGYEGGGIVTMAVDNLPCELSREASDHFSSMLSPLLYKAKDADFTAELESIGLPPELRRAVIVHKGKLVSRFEHLAQSIQDAAH